nr:Chain C, Sir4p [Saccharomyces cerevisiae VL3]
NSKLLSLLRSKT